LFRLKEGMKAEKLFYYGAKERKLRTKAGAAIRP